MNALARDMLERRKGLTRLLAAMVKAAPAIGAKAHLKAGASQGAIARHG